MGIPLHPLLVHGAVVFVPLLILTAIAYAVVPFTRRYVWWAALALAVVAPLATWTARLSGEAFRARKERLGFGDAAFFADLDQHQSFGNMSAYFATGLGVLTLVMVLVVIKRPTEAGPNPDGSAVVSIATAVVVVAVAVVTGYYIFQTGDTGARIVWTGQ